MSVKERMDAEAKRAAEERAAAMAIPKTVTNGGGDPQLEAALKRVAEGISAIAYRTRNGSLVETKAAKRDDRDLHRLQEQGQL